MALTAAVLFTRRAWSRTETLPEIRFAWAFAMAWFLSRIVFYAWWDPFDPFLFAVMSLPCLWLVLLWGTDTVVTTGTGRRARLFALCGLGFLTLVVWAHNARHMVFPLRAISQ